jgi:hypothetical protein
MRIVIPGATLTALGFATVLASFFVSLLGMHRRFVTVQGVEVPRGTDITAL